MSLGEAVAGRGATTGEEEGAKLTFDTAVGFGIGNMTPVRDVSKEDNESQA